MISLFIITTTIGCNKIEVPKIVTSNKLLELSNSQHIEYLSINDEIDNKLSTQINKTYSTLIDKGVENISINIESSIDTKIASYLVKYRYDKNEFLKSYNYDVNTKNWIVVNKNKLIDNLNNQYIGKYHFSENDIGFINYIINGDKIHIYPPQSMFGKLEEVNIPYDHSLIEVNTDFEKGNKKMVALTFDDGPSPWSNYLVDLLEQLDVKASFFVLGSNVEYYPDKLKYIVDHGHEIGNHSYYHHDMKRYSVENCMMEINKTQNIIYQTINRYPRIFRFPYGSVKKDVLKHTDLRSVLWTSDSLDWKVFDYQIVANNAKKGITDSGVILFHDFRNYNTKAITKVVQDLKNDGYEFVTVSELFSFYSYEDFIEKRNYF